MKKTFTLLIIFLCSVSFGKAQSLPYRQAGNISFHSINKNKDRENDKINLLPEPKSWVALYDSIYYWQWDTLANGWAANADDKTVHFVYDAHDNMKSEVGEMWNDTVWANSWQQINNFNTDNCMMSLLKQSWSQSAWHNELHNTFTYDANYNRLSETDQDWNGTAWINTWFYSYSYDANNNRLSELDQSWDTTSASWLNYSLYTNTFDSFNNMTNELLQMWDTASSAWVDNWQAAYIYNAGNKITNKLNKFWNGTAWVVSGQDSYTYDANNNMIGCLAQNWDGSGWVNLWKETSTYDTSNEQLSLLHQTWNGSAWVDFWRYNYTYDADNLMKSFASREWNSAGTKVMYGDSALYYYHAAVGINELTEKEGSIIIYPNPATENVAVSGFRFPVSDLKIFDMVGNLVLEKNIVNGKTSIDHVGWSSYVVDVSEFARGMYVVEVKTERGGERRKFIKL